MGRFPELAVINEAIEDRRCAGVLVAGGIGTGKTRLLDEVLARARRRGAVTEVVTGAGASATIPFGPFARFLAAPTGDRLDALHRVRACVVAAEGAGGQPPVLAVDDAHTLDQDSAALVHHLVVTRAAFVVVAVRRGEAAPAPVTALWKDGLLTRLELGGLTRPETQQLAEAMLGGGVDAETMEWLLGLTGGNPLLVREVLSAGLEQGVLARDQEAWHRRKPLSPPARLAELAGQRFRGLGAEETRVLTLLAFGEPLPAAVLDALTSRHAVLSLEQRGLVRAVADRRRTEIRLADPFDAQLMRTNTGALSARVVRRQLADAIEVTGARRSRDAVDLALWRLESDAEVDPALLTAAAQEALRSFDAALAERLAVAAAEGGGGAPATRCLAEAMIADGRFHEADRVLSQAQGRCADPGPAVGVALTRARNLFWNLGAGGAAEQALQRAAEAAGDHAGRAEVEAARVEFLLWAGRAPEAIERGHRLLERSEAGSTAMASGAAAMCWALLLAGRTDEVASAAQATLVAPSEIGPDRRRSVAEGSATIAHLLARFLGGEMVSASAALERYHFEAREMGAHPVAAAAAFARGWASRLQGRPRTALRWLHEALASVTDVVPHQRAWCLAEVSYASALVGDVAATGAAWREVEEMMTDAVGRDAPLLMLGRAWQAAVEGELSRACSLAMKAAEAAGTAGRHLPEALALHDVVRLGHPDKAASRLAALGDRLPSRLVETFAAHAVAARRGDGAGLEEASRDFEDMGALLFAAEAAAEAAAVHVGHSLRARAAASATRSQALAARCEGARTPALVAADRLFPLTRREREIVAMAGRGLANREIAERLSVSVRTVEGHLYQAFAKLGVADRAALASIIEGGDGGVERPGQYDGGTSAVVLPTPGWSAPLGSQNE